MIIDWSSNTYYSAGQINVIMWALLTVNSSGDITGPVLAFYLFGR